MLPKASTFLIIVLLSSSFSHAEEETEVSSSSGNSANNNETNDDQIGSGADDIERIGVKKFYNYGAGGGYNALFQTGGGYYPAQPQNNLYNSGGAGAGGGFNQYQNGPSSTFYNNQPQPQIANQPNYIGPSSLSSMNPRPASFRAESSIRNKTPPVNKQYKCGVRPMFPSSTVLDRSVRINDDDDVSLAADRIIGGGVTFVEYWPWQVSLQLKGRHACGGSIISLHYIVTAAHCFFGNETSSDPNDWAVYAGLNDLVTSDDGKSGPLDVDKIILHPNYNEETSDSDIALVKLKVPLKYSDRVAPVCIPKQGADLPNDKKCVITGYGQTGGTGGEGYLKKAVLPIITREKCAEFGGDFADAVNERMFCAGFASGEVDSCLGDSGGPLVCFNPTTSSYILQGVISFGFGCAEQNSPGVYTRLSSFTNWISSTIAMKANKKVAT